MYYKIVSLMTISQLVFAGQSTELPLLISELKGHKSHVTSLDFTPNDKRHLISGSNDKTVKLWDIETASITQQLQSDNGIIKISQPSHENTAAYTDGKTIYISDLRKKANNVRLPQIDSYPTTLDYSLQDDHDLACGYERHIALWDTRILKRSITKSTHNLHHKVGTLSKSSRSPNGLYVIFSSPSYKLLILLNSKTHKTDVLLTNSYQPSALGWTPNNQYVILGTRKGQVIAWNPHASLETACDLKSTTSTIASDIKYDQGYIIVSFWDGSVNVINTNSKESTSWYPHDSACNTISCKTKKQDHRLFLATGSTDETIRLWDLSTPQIVDGPFDRKTTTPQIDLVHQTSHFDNAQQTSADFPYESLLPVIHKASQNFINNSGPPSQDLIANCHSVEERMLLLLALHQVDTNRDLLQQLLTRIKGDLHL